jgi:hypothetical protein
MNPETSVSTARVSSNFMIMPDVASLLKCRDELEAWKPCRVSSDRKGVSSSAPNPGRLVPAACLIAEVLDLPVESGQLEEPLRLVVLERDRRQTVLNRIRLAAGRHPGDGDRLLAPLGKAVRGIIDVRDPCALLR